MAFADVFVVTSNADSGPGTLREALIQAAANGSANTDYINFNLSDLSEAGRTIALTSQLPDVSSRLVIDGSTQSGLKFGVSSAKVCLLYHVSLQQSLSGLRVVGQQDVEIYGLFIKNGIDVSAWPINYFWKGIELRNDKNIQIGAAGKGNVINGFYCPLIANEQDNTPSFFENLVLKDNFFGVDIDGQTLSINESQQIQLIYVTGHIDIGGSISEGNVIASGLEIYQNNNSNSNNPDDYYINAEAIINIQNNNIGIDYNSQITFPKCFGLDVATESPGGKSTTTILDNVISTTGGFGHAIFINNIGNKVTILRNYIGTDKARQKVFQTGGIFIYYGNEVQIGGNNPADANYITNCIPVTIWPYSNVTVNKNSFYCSDNTPMHYVGYGAFEPPVIDITEVTTNTVKGTATPNSIVELFYADHCGNCAPETYFASVLTDANGKWQYNGVLTNTVIASATLDKMTSEFTRTSIDASNIFINGCDGRGSITGAAVKGAINIKWVDENGNTVGTQTDLIDVPYGKYKLMIDNGACGTETVFYTIVGGGLTLNTTTVQVKKASCDQSDGSITGITYTTTVGTINSTWTNQDGVVVGTNVIDLTNVPAGSYTLNIRSTNRYRYFKIHLEKRSTASCSNNFRFDQ
jgi:hypothetical protein